MCSLTKIICNFEISLLLTVCVGFSGLLRTMARKKRSL